MGTDITCIVEKKDINTGEWDQITGFVSDYYNPDSDFFSEDRYKSAPSPIDCRNYTLFSMLAGVRMNGREMEVISQPRGVPTEWKEFEGDHPHDYCEWDTYGEYWGHMHSVSWLTLKEILDHLDTDPQMKYKGYVDVEAFKQFIKTGEPSYWCLGAMGVTTTLVSIDDMVDIVKNKKEPPSKYVYTYISWRVSVKSQLTSLIEHSIPQLKERSETQDFNDIRIVFGFDC